MLEDNINNDELYEDLIKEIEEMPLHVQKKLYDRIMEREAIKEKYNISDEDWKKL